ncbi:MAG TPA: hypothetical protein VN962_25795 [Polyangia bacterium]|nr:hypothetical protein [Polyangia bacterium]
MPMTDRSKTRSRSSLVLVAIPALAAEASAILPPTAEVAVVSEIMAALMAPVVVTIVMVTSTVTMVGEAAGRPDDPVHHQRRPTDRSIALLAAPAFAKDAPHDEDETGHEPQEDRLSDLLRRLEKVTRQHLPCRDHVREQESRRQRAEHPTDEPHEAMIACKLAPQKRPHDAER